MELNVKHSEESVDIIKQQIKHFTETPHILHKIKTGCMIKFYPMSDTLDLDNIQTQSSTGGLIHSYFCEVHVYCLKSKKFYVSKIYHDSLRVEGVGCVGSFNKDLGFIYLFDEAVEISYRDYCMVVRKLK